MQKYRSLLQNIVSVIGLFCTIHLNFEDTTNRSLPIAMSADLLKAAYRANRAGAKDLVENAGAAS